MLFVAADKRGRRRLIPDVAMPRSVARLFHERLVAAADKLEEAAGKPNTATGAVERLVILEHLLVDLTELRGLITAWAIEDEMGEAPIEEVARRVGKTGTTVSRRPSEAQIQRLRELS